MTDSLASFYKTNPWFVIRSLMPALLDWNSPLQFKISFARFVNQLVIEVFPLPWWPSLDTSVAAPLRQFFLGQTTRHRTASGDSKPSSYQGASKKLNFLGTHCILPLILRWCTGKEEPKGQFGIL